MENTEERQIQNGFALLLIAVLAVGLPLLLILMRGVIVQYEIVEELVKLLLVIYMVKELGQSARWYYGAGIGVLFGMTETVMYVMNAMMVGSYTGLVMRSVVTVPMHGMTALIIYTIGRKNRGLWWALGYVVAVVVHMGFNISISACQ